MAVRSLTATAVLLAAPLRVYADAAAPWGFNQVLFYDDFSTSNGTLDDSKWQYDIGTQYPGGPENWGTGEIQYYTDSLENIFITHENNLRIVPRNDGNGGWTSARIETTKDHDFGAEVGEKIRVEAKIKLGTASADDQWGIWPAFWSVGSPYRGNYQNWPAVGEVDFFESAHGQPRVWQSLHCGSGTGGACNEPTGLFKEADDDIYNRDDWNIFSWELNRQRGSGWFGAEEYMTWYINDKPLFTVKQSDIGSDEIWGQLADYKKFLILNVAVGGSFANAKAGFQTPDEKTVGGDRAAMEVDYVGIYKA